jgi:hypothetical protein
MSNIHNRLKKLESEVIEDSEFCACEKEFKFQIITCPEDDTQTPGACEVCSKPTPAPFNFTFTINPDVKLTGELNEHSKPT